MKKVLLGWYRQAGFVLLLIFVVSSCFRSPENKELILKGGTMGTTYSIKIPSKPSSITQEQIQSAIEEELKNVNKLMSTFDPGSEISRFNTFKKKTWFSVSRATVDVLSEALRIGRQTEGAMDITVGKLVNLWGFGKDLKILSVPNPSKITELKKISGIQKIELDIKNQQVKKSNLGIYIDLASIAKGYGVDRVSERLKSLGIKNFLVEIGGEIRTVGFKDESSLTPWVIAVEKPVNLKRVLYKKLYLKSNSLATSGDYRNYFEKEGVRFSHTINPKTGYPVTHQLASVSVVHSSCMTADGVATALMVMGAEKGYKWAVQNKIAAYFIYRTENGFDEKITPMFQPFFNLK